MTRSIFIAAALTLAVMLPAVPAQAAASRTFISAAGSDSNNCINVLTPCRHLATAFAATAQDGEIYVLDPANYGSVTITHGVSIEGHGWASIAPASGGNAITINATGATDKINIVGVVLDGTALTSTNGIVFNSGGSLTVRDSIIRNFTSGIVFQPNTSILSQFVVSNTLVSDNGSNGILIEPSGSGTTKGLLDHVQIVNTGGYGASFVTSAQRILVTVNDSVSANNAGTGIFANSIGGTVVNVSVQSSRIANNDVGMQTEGTNTTMQVSRSTVECNNIGWANSAGGGLFSLGDNMSNTNNSGNNPPFDFSYK